MRAPRSIFYQLVRLALVLVVPLLGFIGWGIQQQFQNDREEALRSLGQLRKFAERQIHAYLDNTRQKMERLAYRVDELQRTPGSAEQLLREFAALFPEYRDVSLIDAEGRVVAGSARHSADGADTLMLEEPYRRAIAAQDFVVTEAFKDSATERWTALLSHPVYASDMNGKRTGTLLLRLNLPELSRLFSYDPTENTTLLSVVDDRGVLLMRSFKAEELSVAAHPGSPSC